MERFSETPEKRRENLLDELTRLLQEPDTQESELKINRIVEELSKIAQRNGESEILEIETLPDVKTVEDLKKSGVKKFYLVLSDKPDLIPSGLIKNGSIGEHEVDEWGFYKTPPEGISQHDYERLKEGYLLGMDLTFAPEEEKMRILRKRKKFLKKLVEYLDSFFSEKERRIREERRKDFLEKLGRDKE